jgi:hypothetical protein
LEITNGRDIISWSFMTPFGMIICTSHFPLFLLSHLPSIGAWPRSDCGAKTVNTEAVRPSLVRQLEQSSRGPFRLISERGPVYVAKCELP